jgi:PAS domain S-box-containing protein
MSQLKYRYGTDIDELYALINRLEGQVSGDVLLKVNQENREPIHTTSGCTYSVYFKNETCDISFDIACVNVTGYTTEELSHNQSLWNAIISDEHKAIVADFDAKITQGIYPGVLEMKIIQKDTQVCWVRVTPVLFYNTDGSIRSYKGYVQDISEYKEVCAERDESRKQLIQADKMKSLGVLVAGVAHEINNPNNLISFNGDLLSRFWNDVIQNNCITDDIIICEMNGNEFITEYSKLLESVKEGSYRIKKIVESLKEFAQGDSGSFHDTVDINRVIDSSLFILSALIKSENIKVSHTLASNVPCIKGNFLQIEQVIINLITNACQASQTKELLVSISTEFTDNKVVVSVSDTGDGITDIESIFDPFYTTKRDEGGTGLGLSISYGIIKNHGGDMQFESYVGQGTTARLVFPIRGGQ